MIVHASSNRSTRRSNGMPNASNSVRFQPAPRPSTNRPPLTSSTVDAIFAIRPGGWNPAHATSGPRTTRSVTAARADSRVKASQGPRSPPRPPRYSRWSPTQIWSKPTCSAACAMRPYSGQRTTRSTSGSWIPNRGRLGGGDATDDMAATVPSGGYRRRRAGTGVGQGHGGRHDGRARDRGRVRRCRSRGPRRAPHRSPRPVGGRGGCGGGRPAEPSPAPRGGRGAPARRGGPHRRDAGTQDRLDPAGQLAGGGGHARVARSAGAAGAGLPPVPGAPVSAAWCWSTACPCTRPRSGATRAAPFARRGPPTSSATQRSQRSQRSTSSRSPASPARGRRWRPVCPS
jgi:hypothetical protein